MKKIKHLLGMAEASPVVRTAVQALTGVLLSSAGGVVLHILGGVAPRVAITGGVAALVAKGQAALRTPAVQAEVAAVEAVVAAAPAVAEAVVADVTPSA